MPVFFRSLLLMVLLAALVLYHIRWRKIHAQESHYSQDLSTASPFPIVAYPRFGADVATIANYQWKQRWWSTANQGVAGHRQSGAAKSRPESSELSRKVQQEVPSTSAALRQADQVHHRAVYAPPRDPGEEDRPIRHIGTSGKIIGVYKLFW